MDTCLCCGKFLRVEFQEGFRRNLMLYTCDSKESDCRLGKQTIVVTAESTYKTRAMRKLVQIRRCSK